MQNFRRVFIGLTEVDFESLKAGDKFILREPDGKLVGCYLATGSTGDFNGVPGVVCEPLSEINRLKTIREHLCN